VDSQGIGRPENNLEGFAAAGHIRFPEDDGLRVFAPEVVGEPGRNGFQ
jgi:hypothetical protein